MSINVKWGKEKLNIPIGHDYKLGKIRQALSDYSHIPVENIKLIYSGATMKDDSYPVSAYGITDGSVIHMVGSKDLPPSRNGFIPPKEVSHRPTEPELVRKIQDEVDKVHKSLVPPLNAFLAALPSSPQPPSKDLEREHLRLGELLLQSLLRLDALSPEGTWEDARGHRKVAVREVQGLLDQLDDGWKQFKNHAVT